MDLESDIFCLGHVSVDIIINRKTLTNLRSGGNINSQELTIYGGGDAANVSFWLGTLKTSVSLIGVIADDHSGHFLKKELRDANVRCRLKISKQFPTAINLVIVESDGERSFIRNNEIQKELKWEDIPFEAIEKSRLFYTSAYVIENSPVKNAINRLFRLIKRNVNSTTPMTMFNLASYTTVEKFKTDIRSNILPYTDILVGNKDEYSILAFNTQNGSYFDYFSIGNEI
ncbi:MAG: carbohydrate kinase family protein, partial [Candidatus Hodarchaeota archaeon]